MNYAETLDPIARPFCAAILSMDEPLRPSVVSQFSPELVGRVHEAFVAHLLYLQEGATDLAAEQLLIVERAGLLQYAWQAVAHIRSSVLMRQTIDAAKRGLLH